MLAELGMFFDGAVEFLHVGSVVLVVMQLHGGFIDVRLESGVVVGKRRNFVVGPKGYEWSLPCPAPGYVNSREWETDWQADSVYTSMDAVWRREVPSAAIKAGALAVDAEH